MATTRKRIASIATGVAIGMILCSAAVAQPTELLLPGDVTTVEEFIEFRDATAVIPEGGAAVFVLAMLLYEQDANLGHDALVIALDAGELRESDDGYRGFTLGNRAREFVTRYLAPKPYIARSYIVGTDPQDGYALPDELTVRITRNRVSELTESRNRVFVACTGADSPRPITLDRNNRGIWKAYEYSSLFVGVRPPAEVEDDPL